MTSPGLSHRQMKYEDVISRLRTLTAWDFDYSNPAMSGPKLLDQLTECLLELPERQLAVPELFDVMERLPEADLGTPGPLVHTLEQMDYIEELIRSVQRLPTVLAVWMISRLLNTGRSPEHRQLFLDLLAKIPDHPQATYGTREDAKHFLRLHTRKK